MAYADQNSLRLFIIIVDKSLLLLFWVLLLRIPNIEYNKIKTSYLLIPIFTIAFLCMMMLSPNILGIDQHLFFILVLFLFCLVNASYFILHQTNEKQNTIILRKSFQRQQKTLHYQYYGNMETFLAHLQHMRQEINEHLQIIWLLARHASLKEFEKYSQQIQAINEQLGNLSMTGNHMLMLFYGTNNLWPGKWGLILSAKQNQPQL